MIIWRCGRPEWAMDEICPLDHPDEDIECDECVWGVAEECDF